MAALAGVRSVPPSLCGELMSALPCVTDWLVPGSPVRPRVIAELGKHSAANPAEQFPCSAVSPAVMRSSVPSSIPRACGRRGTAGFCRTSCSFQFPGWIWPLLLPMPPCWASGQRALSCAESTCVLAPPFSCLPLSILQWICVSG